MPYIKTITNVEIPPEKGEAIKAQLGQDAALIGKSEDWLMVENCGGRQLYFKGSDAPAALVSVDLYGQAGADAYAGMTTAVTKLMNEQLGIDPARVFVKYGEYQHWGWNGSNF